MYFASPDLKVANTCVADVFNFFCKRSQGIHMRHNQDVFPVFQFWHYPCFKIGDSALVYIFEGFAFG